MSYQAKFTGWQNLTLEDLVVAYRKAKADFHTTKRNIAKHLKAIFFRESNERGISCQPIVDDCRQW